MPTFEGVSFLGKPTRVDAGTHNGARNKPNEDRFARLSPGRVIMASQCSSWP